jgi:HPt (histidine-containing phosphotransfer) domain-containing protein
MGLRGGLRTGPSERESIEESAWPTPPPAGEELASPIDSNVIAPLRDLGSDDLRELVRMFLDEAKGRVARLRVLRQQGDAPELAKVAHTLRGTSAAFGATRLTALCAEIEATRDTGDGGRLSTLVDAVAMEFERVQTALTEELS